MVNSQIKQQGVVLIVALVFLISLTAVASVMMLNSTTDMKISGASEEKLIATQEAVSAVDEAIADQIRSDNNLFTKSTYPEEVTTIDSVTINDANVTNYSIPRLAVTCPRMRANEAFSDGTIDCNMVILEVNKRYGKSNTSNVNVKAGIAQQLIGGN